MTQAQQTIERLEENIKRLNQQIQSNFFQKGYVANCKQYIESYQAQIDSLKAL